MSEYPLVKNFDEIYDLPTFKDNLTRKVVERIERNFNTLITADAFINTNPSKTFADAVRDFTLHIDTQKTKESALYKKPKELVKALEDIAVFGDKKDGSFWYEGMRWVIGDGDDTGAVYKEDGYCKVWVRCFDSLEEVNFTRGIFSRNHKVYLNANVYQHLAKNLIDEMARECIVPMSQIANKTKFDLIDCSKDKVQICIDFNVEEFDECGKHVAYGSEIALNKVKALQKKFEDGTFGYRGTIYKTKMVPSPKRKYEWRMELIDIMIGTPSKSERKK